VKELREIGKRLKTGEDKTTIVKITVSLGTGTQELGASGRPGGEQLKQTGEM